MLPISSYQGDLWARAQGCDATVVMVAHDAYRDVDWKQLELARPILVDGRRVFDAAQVQAAGFVYRSVGRS